MGGGANNNTMYNGGRTSVNGLLGRGRGYVNDENASRTQAMEATSFSRLSRPLDEMKDSWSSSIFGSVLGIPTLNAEACNLLTLA